MGTVLEGLGMCSVYVLDFVLTQIQLVGSEMSFKEAKRLAKKLNKRDPFSLAFVAPLGFDFASCSFSD